MIFEQSDIDRINEIKFLEICTRIYKFRNDFSDITLYLKQLQPFLNCDLYSIITLSKEIFERKYQPTIQEIAIVLYQQGMTKELIAQHLKKSRPTIIKWLNDPQVLYPRSSPNIRQSLNQFILDWERLEIPDLRHIDFIV